MRWLLLAGVGLMVGCASMDYVQVYDDATTAIDHNTLLGCTPTGNPGQVQINGPSSEYACPKKVMSRVYHYGWTR